MVQILKLLLHFSCSNKLIKNVKTIFKRTFIVYISNCKSQQKLYQKQLFFLSIYYIFLHLFKKSHHDPGSLWNSFILETQDTFHPVRRIQVYVVQLKKYVSRFLRGQQTQVITTRREQLSQLQWDNPPPPTTCITARWVNPCL